jgi:hypothetical protein
LSVTRNFAKLDTIPLTDAATMRDVGLLARERIVRRTRAGKGTDNAPFEPYSADYRARKGKELGASHPNLTVSGTMLNDITILHVDNDTVTLGFKS